MFGAVRDAHLVHHTGHPLAAHAGRDIVIQERKLDVFFNRQLINQVERLEDETDVLLADIAEFGLRLSRNIRFHENIVAA